LQYIKFRLTGTCPLMVNNPQTVNPFNVWTKQMKAITDKRKKTDEDNHELMRLKWMAGLYIDPAIGPFLPSICVWRALLDAARISRSGKMIERGVQCVGDKLPILYRGPRNPDEMYESGVYVDVRDASPGGKRVTAVRPIFPEWKVEPEMMFDPNQVSERDIVTFMELAGRVSGVGTYRRIYGRFTSEVIGAEAQKLAA